MADQPVITAFDIWDEANPRSLINLLPTKTQDLIREAYNKVPDLFGIPERELRSKLASMACGVSANDNRLRLAFWQEYERAQGKLDKMRISMIPQGIMAHGYFTDKYLRSPTRVAWLLCPPASYAQVTEEALQYGMEVLRDILEEPHNLPNGQLNMKLIETKLKIVAMIDLRMKGLPTQKIEQKNLTYSLHDSMKSTAAASLDATMSELNKKLKELEMRERRALNIPEPSTPAPAPEKDEPIDAEFKSV